MDNVGIGSSLPVSVSSLDPVIPQVIQIRQDESMSPAEQALADLLEEAWPGLRSYLIIPRDLLYLHIRQLLDEVQRSSASGNNGHAQGSLRSIQRDLSLAFSWLNQEDGACNPPHEAKLCLIRALGKLDELKSSDGRVEKLREAISCVFRCLESDPQLFDKPRGLSISSEEHRPYLESLFKIILADLKDRPWKTLKRRGMSFARLEKKAHRLRLSLLSKLEAQRAIFRKIDWSHSELQKLERIHALIRDEHSKLTKLFTIHLARDEIHRDALKDYVFVLDLHLFHLPSELMLCPKNLQRVFTYDLDTVSLQACREIMTLLEELRNEVRGSVEKILRSEGAGVARECVQKFILCLKSIEEARGIGLEQTSIIEDSSTRSRQKSDARVALLQGLTKSLKAAHSLLRTLPAAIERISGDTSLDDEICLALTHSRGLLEYSVNGALESTKLLCGGSRQPAKVAPSTVEATPVSKPGSRKRRRRKRRQQGMKSKVMPLTAAPIQEAASKIEVPKSVPLPMIDATDPVEAVESSKDFLLRIDEGRPAGRAHPVVYSRHSKRLGHTRAALLELNELGSTAKRLSERKALLFQKISRCQQLLESALKRCLAERKVLSPEGSHVLDIIPPGGTTPLHARHSLVMLARPLGRMLDDHKNVIKTLDAAHSLVFYLERSSDAATRQGAKRLCATLKALQAATNEHELKKCELVVQEIVEQTLGCTGTLVDRSGESEATEELAGSVGEVELQAEAEEITASIEQTIENRLPPIHNSKGAQERIRLCRQLLRAAKHLPVASGKDDEPRLRQRNLTLSHVDRYLTWLDTTLWRPGDEVAKHPLSLTLPALDALHRALKEVVVAAHQHQAIDASQTELLIYNNNVCATFKSLVAYYESQKQSAALHRLPADFEKQLAWLSGIHERLWYPDDRRGEQKNSVYSLVAGLERIGRQLREATDADLEEGWTLKKGGKAIDPEKLHAKLLAQTDELLETALFPGIDALYLILRAAF